MTSSPRRKRGGQPGNTNALKHGFYARSLGHLEDKLLEPGSQAGLDEEETLLRMLIFRTAKSMGKRNMTHAGYVVALRTVALAVGRIQSLHRSRKAIHDYQTILAKVLEELK